MTDTVEANPEASAWRPSRTFWTIYGSLLLAMLLSALDQTIVATALPTVVGDLGGLSLMAWVITAYTLAMTISMPIWGKYGDLLGRRGLFITALSLFVGGSALCGFSQNIGELIAFRALQGAGGGGLMVLSQAILAELIPPRKRSAYMAPLGATFGVASVLGPLLGGFITDHWSWHWIFWINLPLGGAALAACVMGLKLPKHNGAFTVDIGGIATLGIAVISLTLLVAWGGTTFAWTSLPALGLGAVAVGAALAFIYFEKHAADPLIPLRLFANPGFSIPTALGVVAALGMFAAVSYMPTYLQMVYGLSGTESGLFMLPLVGCTMLMSLVSGAVIARTGNYRIFPVLGMATIGVALFLLSTLSSQTSVWLIAGCLAILGVGLGCVLQILVLIVQNVVSKDELGTATSANNFFREIGATIGIAVVGGLFSSHLSGALAGLDLARPSGLGSVEDLTPAIVAALPSAQQAAVVAAYSEALIPLYGYLAPVFIAAVVLAFFVPNASSLQAAPSTGH